MSAMVDQVEQVMDFLRREYDYVLIDSSAALQNSKASIIDQSDEIYIVSTPDVAALRDLARLVENLSLSDSATSKLARCGEPLHGHGLCDLRAD